MERFSAQSLTNSALPSRPGSAPRHQEVADYPQVEDSVDDRVCPQKTLILTVTLLMTPTTDLGLSIRFSIFELRETGDWDLFRIEPAQSIFFLNNRIERVQSVFSPDKSD